MRSSFLTTLQNIAPVVRENEPMAQHTTFRIGGPADYYAEAKSLAMLKDLLRAAKRARVPARIIGNGSNLLIDDGGVSGLVIKLTGSFVNIERKGNSLLAGAGATLASVAAYARSCGLSGLEFAGGIPGTVGGAILMNAGAYGGEMKDVVEAVPYLNAYGRLAERKKEKLEFGYRTSFFQGRPVTILGCSLSLTPGDRDAISEKMADFNERRRAKQPLEYPSAGSTFKRPPGLFAGTLIDEAGLKGLTVGGAQVSTKHAGFIINTGHATAQDVLDLIDRIQKDVVRDSGILLEPEVCYWKRI